MIEAAPPLSSVYKGWDRHHRLLREMVSSQAFDQLALRAAPQLRSIGELAAHVIAVRARCLYFVLEEGEATLADLVRWDRTDAPVRTVPELLSGLDSTWQVLQDGLSLWRSSDLEDTLQGEKEGVTYHSTRQRVIWHMLEHDIHHAGELSLTLGMHGGVGLDL
jgi:uncharacterized damage-inducible protein DinB